ncbi:MAG: hypothetical protein H6744_12735 [Deltaproteobacteria bacterium]|nr:hypothetical protein [Deltaproteobacteria bacterium]MCB9787539.1 hypothetical protein [Deltaproteobacteria bacterium]
MRSRSIANVACALFIGSLALACSGDGGSSDVSADLPDSTGDLGGDLGDGGPLPGQTAFAFALAPTTVSKAPFPNDIYLRGGGLLAVPPLAADPVFSTLTNAEALATLDQRIAERSAFGVSGAIHFYMEGEPDMASVEGKAFIVALDGPEEGTRIPANAFWFAPGHILGLIPSFGHYLVPGSTYGAFIEAGVTAATGEAVAAPEPFLESVSATAPAAPSSDLTAMRQAMAPLRAWMASEGYADDALAIATVFTTQPSLPYLQSVIDAADDFTLEPPTRRVSFDTVANDYITADAVEGAALDTYFGVPTAPFQYNPGRWAGGSRADAAALAGAPYTGGTLHHGIGRVINGSIVVPALNQFADGTTIKSRALTFTAGAPTWTLDAMVPFSLFLCDGQLANPADLPVAIFTHGGTSIRADAISLANVNCLSGIATIALDQPFHGGRTTTALREAEGLIVPTRQDDENVYTGLEAGDAGFVGDAIGDAGGPTQTVAPLFAIADRFDPAIIEANLLTIPFETKLLVRYLKEADWSQVQQGLSFDADLIFHQSLSFGTSFTTALMAVSDDFRGVVNSVGSVMMVSANLPVAPSNAALAAPILQTALGLQSTPDELKAGAWRDPVIAMFQWLSERGEAVSYAPFVLRHRSSTKVMSVLSSGDSWDETLYSPPQLSFNNAYGLEVFEAGAEWTLDATIPGAETVDASPLAAAGTEANVTYDGRMHSAGLFYRGASCHAELVAPLCRQNVDPPHPPATPKATPNIFASPICQLQHQIVAFNNSLLTGSGPGLIVPPSGTCDDLYAP